MKKTKTKTARAGDRLSKALNRLAKSEKRVARGNARTETLAALRAVRAAVDSEYPIIPKAKKKRVKLTPVLRANRLRKQGMVLLPAYHTGMHSLQRIRAAGIRVEVIGDSYFVKDWAALAISKRYRVAELLELARSPKKRRAFMAEKMLTED